MGTAMFRNDDAEGTDSMQVNLGTTTVSIRDIVDAWVNGSLSRNPEYQRGESWSVSQQELGQIPGLPAWSTKTSEK